MSIRRTQAIYDLRTGFTTLLDTIRDLRELSTEYAEAQLANRWSAADFTPHDLAMGTMQSAITDLNTLIVTFDTLDTNMKKVRN